MPHAQPALWAILIVVGCAALSALLIFILRPLLLRYLMAHPNARSSHKSPTPQGAGLAVMASVLTACAIGLFYMGAAEPRLLWPLVAAAGLTFLGAADDMRSLPVWLRLLSQFLAACAVVVTLPEGFRLLPGLMPAAVEDALLVVGIVWFVNAVNFLDGLDWMMVAQAVPVTLAVAVLHFLGIVPGKVGLLALALLGAMLGFAVFNKHPARIFLGDAGSLPIGLCLAYLLIFVAKANLAAAILLGLYTLADATATLVRRAARKEPLFAAHRTHYYQRAVAEGFSVPQVTARIFLLEIVLGVLAVLVAVVESIAVDLAALGLGLAATALTLWLLARGPR
jgi:UDP-N-acetylmuramyl pentapeptide phosphotransferase/UDP-N-acetylglucosamine-1-phosphate transferase